MWLQPPDNVQCRDRASVAGSCHWVYALLQEVLFARQCPGAIRRKMAAVSAEEALLYSLPLVQLLNQKILPRL